MPRQTPSPASAVAKPARRASRAIGAFCGENSRYSSSSGEVSNARCDNPHKAAACGRTQQNADFGTAPRQIDCAQSADAEVLAFVARGEDGEDRGRRRRSRLAQRGDETAARPLERQRRAGMAHDFGVAVDAAVQGLVVFNHRPQAHAFRREREIVGLNAQRAVHTKPTARSSSSSRLRTAGFGSSSRAGGSTTVACRSMSAATRPASVVCSMRGAWIGSVATL